MKSMPTSSASTASFLLSGQFPVPPPGTKVTARPDEQLAPNRPSLSLLSLCMLRRVSSETEGADAGACKGTSMTDLCVSFLCAAAREQPIILHCTATLERGEI